MSRHIDLDNPTDEQRLIVEMYERACKERDSLRAQLASCEQLSLERYQENEELRAALGEPNQQAPSVTAGLREDLATMTARYEKAHADCQEMIRLNDELTKRAETAECERDEVRVECIDLNGWLDATKAALSSMTNERDEARMLTRDAQIQAEDRGDSYAAVVALRDQAATEREAVARAEACDAAMMLMRDEVGRVLEVSNEYQRRWLAVMAERDQATATERERCASIVASWPPGWTRQEMRALAAAIRANAFREEGSE